MEARIGEALSAVAEMLRIDSAAIELVEYEARTGTAVLRLRGDCPDCQMSVGMLQEGIAAQLRLRVPEIREVRAV